MFTASIFNMFLLNGIQRLYLYKTKSNHLKGFDYIVYTVMRTLLDKEGIVLL